MQRECITVSSSVADLVPRLSFSALELPDHSLKDTPRRHVSGSLHCSTRNSSSALQTAMNTVNTTAVFTNAVEAINRGHDGNYQQASVWLSEFKYDPNAWGTLLELINSSSHGDVLFHAANIANSKAKNEWSQITDDLRRSLLQVVRCVGSSMPSESLVQPMHSRYFP